MSPANPFPRTARLTTGSQFGQVFAAPAVSQDRYFRVLHRANGESQSRLGMAVSVKICARAVGRNRIKRLVRESFRRSQQTLSEVQGRDLVVLPARQAVTATNRELVTSLAQHWSRIGKAPIGGTRPNKPDAAPAAVTNVVQGNQS